MFNLDKEIGIYCRSVYPNWYDAADKIEELKDHIYCEIARLIKTGLSEEEAFAKATQQLGNVDELRAEFSKDRTWRTYLNALIDWRYPVHPQKAAILHILLGLLFVAVVIPVDWIVDRSAYAHYSNEVTNVLLGVYLIPFMYLSFAAEQLHASCRSRFSFVKHKVSNLFSRK